jgi:uncharacterized protein (DUF433 family)
MVFQVSAEVAPIFANKDGVALIGNTRVTLQMVIAAFHRGDSPEQIVDSFDVLSLADVYAVIAYYLNHREEIDDYIKQQKSEAEQVRLEIETNQPDMFTLRNRLLEKKRERA